MLSDKDLRLLNAFVDGELTPRERKAALRFLHGSSEARLVLRDLQENVHRLQQLPTHKLPADFTNGVMGLVQKAEMRPAPARPVARRRFLPWVAAAAALLLATVGGYFLIRPADPEPHRGGSGAVAHTPSVDPWVAQINDGAVLGFGKPLPPALQIAFRDLDQLPERQRLSQELKKQTAFRVELAVRNQNKAVDRLDRAFKEHNVTLLVDAGAKARLQKKEPGTELVLYAENLRPEEVAAILQHLNQRAVPKNKNQEPVAPFESMYLTSFSQEDQNQLANLMGAKPEQFQPAKQGDNEKIFNDVPIEKGPDKLRGPKDGKKAGPEQKEAPPPRYAVVLASRGSAPGKLSKEVKSFLASRQRPRPGTVQVVLVLSQA